MPFAELIVGCWANIDKNGMDFGSTRDKYFSNGTKCIEVAIWKSGVRSLYKASAKWHIAKNVLTEEITEIDKKAVKAFGFKKGFTSRAYIQSLDSEHLVLKQLDSGARRIVKPVVLTRVEKG